MNHIQFPQNVQSLIDLLQDGETKAIHANEVEETLGIPPGTPNQTNTRNLVKKAVVDFNLPIGSTASGYFLIDSQYEFDRVLAFLGKRLTNEREQALNEGWRLRQESRQNDENWPK
jgi:hypothetical protein